MPTLRSVHLKMFPSATRLHYVVFWRTERRNTHTDLRLFNGWVERTEWPDGPPGILEVIEAAAADIRRRGGVTFPPRSGPGAPGGGGGRPDAGQRLPGIDPDE